MDSKNKSLIYSMFALKCELPPSSKLQKYLTEEIIKLLNSTDCPEDSLTQEEINAGQNEGKLACVRLHRNRTGISLVYSKKCVEDFFQKNNLNFKPLWC